MGSGEEQREAHWGYVGVRTIPRMAICCTVPRCTCFPVPILAQVFEFCQLINRYPNFALYKFLENSTICQIGWHHDSIALNQTILSSTTSTGKEAKRKRLTFGLNMMSNQVNSSTTSGDTDNANSLLHGPNNFVGDALIDLDQTLPPRATAGGWERRRLREYLLGASEQRGRWSRIRPVPRS